MNIPGYAAEASLYKTRRMYRGPTGTFGAGAAPHIITAALDCGDKCALESEVCTLACAVGSGGFGLFVCLLACGVQFADCLSNCPSNGSGGGGLHLCCPYGTTCRCGGKCVPGKGCVGGVCLRPNQECP